MTQQSEGAEKKLSLDDYIFSCRLPPLVCKGQPLSKYFLTNMFPVSQSGVSDKGRFGNIPGNNDTFLGFGMSLC